MSESEVFSWQGRELATIGDLMDEIGRIHAIAGPIEREAQASEFMAAYRAHTEHADVNIGYLTGYFGHDTMVSMLRLFGCSHPVFGGPELADRVTPDGAFAAGQAIGQRMGEEAQN